MLQETTVGALNYNVLRNILKLGGIVQMGRGAEIGVLRGDTSTYLLSEFPNLSLFCVDPWLEYKEGDADRCQNTMSNYEEISRQRLSKFGDRAKIMKMCSIDAAPLIPDGSLDFVFIDAIHEYEPVKQDIAAWYPKVRKDGIFAGHDYRWTDVGRAVNEFSEAYKIDGAVTPPESDIWFFIKP